VNTFLSLAVLALLPAQPGDKTGPRERHPLAPSLPLLSKEEEAKVEKIIDRFIDYDTGKLRGPEGAQALKDFKDLGPEAIPALIDGFNRAANLEHSCPASVIARKLVGFLQVSNDPQLLDFARENIGAGVTAKRHQGVLKDLRLACMLRKSALQRRALASGGQAGSFQKGLRAMSVAELVSAAARDRGSRLDSVLIELETRKGPAVVNTLSDASLTYEEDTRKLAQELLQRHLSRQDGPTLKKLLQDDHAPIRAAAAQAIGARGLRYGQELIDRLGDENPDVWKAARQALVQLAHGTDYGPEPDASTSARAEAVGRWQAWWDRQNKK
jgi:hypothetical protein